MKKRILIIGGGNGGARFCESLSFEDKYELILTAKTLNGKTEKLARKFSVRFELYNKIITRSELKKIDMVIICTPPGTKLEILKRLIELDCFKPIIFEKPLSLEPKRAKKILELLERHKIRSNIAYIRRFEKNKFNKIKTEKMHLIEWPYFSEYKINPLAHILPHILDTIILMTGKKIIFQRISFENNNYVVEGRTTIPFTIKLYKGNKKAPIIINGKEIKWPNHFDLYPLLVEKTFKSDPKENEKIFTESINISYILKKILKQYENHK